MSEIKPKKEKRFLKTLGRVGEILVEQVLLKIGSSLIKKIGGKKPLPSILFLFLSLSLFAQFPNTGNKQRLGFQTTADGLTWRGSISDTASIQPINNTSAWVILDTINLKFYTFDFTSNIWNALPQGTNIDTTSLSNRIDLKLNISDTAEMLLPYATKLYVDTAGRFYARQDFTNAQTSTLTWTQNDTLVPLGVNKIMVYRNGQILLPSQYTIPNKTTIIIAATSFKVGENYTVIFPKGGGGSGGSGGGGGGGGSGSVTSISQGTGIIATPNPIVSTGSIAADTSFLITRFDTLAMLAPYLLKLDTAAMLLPYATKLYVDTAGRFYARQDYTTGVTSSTLTWTQTDTLIPGGVTFVQVYRNGQILLPSQYTIPNKTTIIIAASSFKVNDNYTVIFPRGGGAGSAGGSGSLTSISGGTGILVSPDPITTTGTVSADLSVLMELSDTASLSNRINTKLTATDTASLSSRIDAKGTGTVTNIETGYGITGGAITTIGTLVLDSAVVFSQIRDSIVDVAIGNDTIKILKQEYAPATTSVLTWTITPKFPIQLKQYILVFRNGQLLINDQYNLTDTNKITIVSNSFKVGANYTVVTVSGIGSVGTGVFPNAVYPEAGIAVSTGSAWASSVPNNSSNWNIAFNDKINNAAFSGTTTKTLTLTQYDGGTFTPTFTDLQGIVSADTASMLAPYLRKADTSLLNLTSRFAAKLNLSDTSNMLVPYLRKADTTLMLSKYLRKADTSLLNLTSRFAAKLNLSDTASMLTNYLRSGVAASTYLTQSNAASTYLPLTGGTLTGNLRLASSVGTQLNIDANDNNLESRITFSTVGSARTKIYTTSSVSSMTFESIAQASAKRGFRFISSTEGNSYLGLVQDPQGNVGIKSDATGNDLHPNTLYVNGTLGVTGNITEAGNNVLTNLDTVSLSSRIDAKYNSSGGTISGAVTLSTTTATPSSLLGKDGSNVVGTVTTVAQTGLMTRDLESNRSTTPGSELISVTHNLGSEPTSVLITVFGSTSYILQVASKTGSTFTVQVKNYDGTPAIDATLVSFSWLAIK